MADARALMMVPFGFPWESLAARVAQGVPLPDELLHEAPRQDTPIPGLDDHLVPWARKLPTSVRMPTQPIRDVDNQPICAGQRVLYAGRWELKRATVIRVRERSRWGERAMPEVHVRQDDGRTVTILHYPHRILVLP